MRKKFCKFNSELCQNWHDNDNLTYIKIYKITGRRVRYRHVMQGMFDIFGLTRSSLRLFDSYEILYDVLCGDNKNERRKLKYKIENLDFTGNIKHGYYYIKDGYIFGVILKIHDGLHM